MPIHSPPMSLISPEHIKRIIVRGANWVGDSVMTVPALRALRRLLPKAHITLATRAWANGLFEDVDFIDELLPYEGHSLGSVIQRVSQWRRGRFDLAVIFPNSFEAALVPAAALVPIRVGYRKEARGPLLTNPLPVPEERNSKHEVFYYLNIVAEVERLLLGTQSILNGVPDASLSVRESRRSDALGFLRDFGIENDRPVVALCPGSTNSRAKRWPADRYAALADRLIDELGAHVLLLGSTEELDVSLETARCMLNVPAILTGRTDLTQAVALLSVVDLLVTNDTGPAHIAAALGRPTLVIFGPTNPLTTRPFSKTAQLMRQQPDCAPCMLRDCPIDHRCMTAISSADVFAQACAMLGDRKRRRQEAGGRGQRQTAGGRSRRQDGRNRG
jgi:lipopolysaccharide heptosyltransferase II